MNGNETEREYEGQRQAQKLKYCLLLFPAISKMPTMSGIVNTCWSIKFVE